MATERATDAAAAQRAPVLWFGLRRSAVIETVLFLAAALALDALFLAGDRYWQVAPHPFWIIVLLVSAQYGTGEGLLAAALAGAALLTYNLPEPGLSEDLHAYLYELSARPLFWLMAAVVFGELRERQIRERDALKHDLDAAEHRTELITEAYERLDETKQRLEVRVTGQLRTVVSMYEAAKAVETMEPARVMMGALDNLRAIMNPAKCSLFVLQENVLQAGIQTGWDAEDRFSRMFTADSALFTTIVGGQRTLCVSNPADERVLAGEGVLAGPFINPKTGEVRGMLKIEALGFLDLNLSTVELFRALCEWVGAFYANAQRYTQVQDERSFDSETRLYSSSFYSRQTALLVALGRRVGFRVTQVVLRLDDPYGLDRDQRRIVSAALATATERVLRSTDLPFEQSREGWSYSVLLPATPPDHGRLVADRLVEGFREALTPELRSTPVTVGVEELTATDTDT